MRTTDVVGIIPARYASTRFPGKILAPICGRPLIAWVVERVRQAQRAPAGRQDYRFEPCMKRSRSESVDRITVASFPSEALRVSMLLKNS